MVKDIKDVSPERQAQIKAAAARAVKAYGVKNVAQLLRRLGRNPNTVNQAVNNCNMPYSMLEQCSIDTGVSMDWLLTGVDPSLQLTEALEDSLEAAFAKVFSDHDRYKILPRPKDEADLFAHKLALSRLPAVLVDVVGEVCKSRQSQPAPCKDVG